MFEYEKHVNSNGSVLRGITVCRFDACFVHSTNLPMVDDEIKIVTGITYRNNDRGAVIAFSIGKLMIALGWSK